MFAASDSLRSIAWNRRRSSRSTSGVGSLPTDAMIGPSGPAFRDARGPVGILASKPPSEPDAAWSKAASTAAVSSGLDWPVTAVVSEELGTALFRVGGITEKVLSEKDEKPTASGPWAGAVTAATVSDSTGLRTTATTDSFVFAPLTGVVPDWVVGDFGEFEILPTRWVGVVRDFREELVIAGYGVAPRPGGVPVCTKDGSAESVHPPEEISGIPSGPPEPCSRSAGGSAPVSIDNSNVISGLAGSKGSAEMTERPAASPAKPAVAPSIVTRDAVSCPGLLSIVASEAGRHHAGEKGSPG